MGKLLKVRKIQSMGGDEVKGFPRLLHPSVGRRHFGGARELTGLDVACGVQANRATYWFDSQ